MQIKKYKNIFKFILILVFFTGYFSVVNASNLFFSPEGGNHNVGDIISVKVKVSSPSVSINAISARLVYTKDTMNLVSISKAGTIISLWAQDPSWSNSTGNASFEGVSLAGYTGDGATVVTLNFKALKEGVSNVNFVSASVLANDGEGTNTLTNTNQANFNIIKKEIVKTPQTPVVEAPAPIQKTKTEIVPKETPVVEDSNPAPIKNYIQNPRIEYMVFGISPIVFYLCILWIIIVFIILYAAVRYKYKIRRKLNEVKDLTRQDFDLLKEDQKANLDIIGRDLDNVERDIIKEIDEIEKI